MLKKVFILLIILVAFGCSNRYYSERTTAENRQLFEQKIKEGKKSKLNLPPDFVLSKMSGQLLKKGLEMDDPVSKEIISDSAYYVGLGLYNIFQALNPPLIVLGGGLTNWGDFYLDKIKSTFYELASDMLYDPIEIVISKIGADAGVIGAAALTLE